MSPVITQLNIYPLKSAKGLRLSEMIVTGSGPRFDRQWMIAKPNGQFVSQRTHPKLSQIQPELTESSLNLSAPNMERLLIPLDQPTDDFLEIKIFGKEAKAQKLGSLFDEWISDYLNESLHLVRSEESGARRTSGNRGPVTPIHFADGYPFLLTNQSTLDFLNKKLPSPISMDRFRPNIVIKTDNHDEEDLWKSFSINNLPFLSVKACTRCKIIDIDPTTGASSKQVSQALKSYRMEEGQIVFGQNLIHQATGKIKVGDSLESIELKNN